MNLRSSDLAISLIILLLFSHTSRATIINIPDDYPSIQQGVDAAMNGDTVLVHPGDYYENVQASGKILTLASCS